MIMLIVAFATGVSVPAVQAQSHHDQIVQTVAMNMGNDATCPHDGCPIDQHANMNGVCFATGSGASVLPPANTVIHFTVAQDILVPSVDRAGAGHTFPPDPHPPKQIALI